MVMKSFTLPITTADQLLEQIANHFITIHRKEWHNMEASVENSCDFCFKPLKLISDPLIGVEWVCDNRLCTGR